MGNSTMPPDLLNTRLYFAYGSNMSSEQVLERKLKMTVVGTARLINYKLMFNKKSKKDNSVGFANIIPFWGSEVHGVVYDISNLSKDESRKMPISVRPKSERDEIIATMRNNVSLLDKFEGYPDHYQKTNVGVILDVRIGTTEKINAFTYIAGLEQQATTNLFIREEYIEKITKGLNEHKINEEYSSKTKSLMELWKAV